MSLDNVLPLLRSSTQDVTAATVQDACKHFFLANYNHCAELRDCEGLDPRLLCELMRLHNSRSSSLGGSASRSAGQSILCPSPSPLSVTEGGERNCPVSKGA